MRTATLRTNNITTLQAENRVNPGVWLKIESILPEEGEFIACL